MRILHGGIGRTLYTIPFRKVHFQLVSLIPYSAISKKILIRSLIFHVFTRVENQPLKQGLYLPTLLNIFSYRNIFCFIKYIIFFSIIIPNIFFGIQNKQKVTGHSFFEVFELKNLNF